MKSTIIYFLIVISLLSCSNKREVAGHVTEIWICPYAGIGNFSYIYIYLQSEDTGFSKSVLERDVSTIDVIGITGFNMDEDIIIKDKVDKLDPDRFVIQIQTKLDVTKRVLSKNKVLDTMQVNSFLYRISEKDVGVHIETQNRFWNFGK